MDTIATSPLPAEPASLPEDLEQCHALIRELAATLEERDRNAEQLTHRIDQLLRRLYGKRSERIDPAQLFLFAQKKGTEGAEEDSASSDTPPCEASGQGKRKGHGRKALPDNLPRHRIEHDVAPEEKVCAECGGEKKRIGEEVSEQLDYTPASLFVKEHVRPKYACPCCQGHVVIADKPAQPIEKGLPGPGLIAHIITSKYCDHQPLYRQSNILDRHGVDIPRSTLCGWMMTSADVLEPLVAAAREVLCGCKVIQTDDTPIRVLDPQGTHTGRFWVYLGDERAPYVLFDYTENRSREGPLAFLTGYRGSPEEPRYVQADAYPGYNCLYAHNELIEVGCMAHCRRYFYDAQTSDVLRSHQALAYIKDLYRVEKSVRDGSAEERYAVRQERACPMLDEFEDWMKAEQPVVLPKSPMALAFGYALGHWEALRRYVEDGDLCIDNNAAEREIRPIAVGRRNYLFAGSDRGGRAAAILYSLVASAKRHSLDPFVYLRDVLERIATHPNTRIDELLPDNWKALQ